jgi:hypothetical protein
MYNMVIVEDQGVLQAAVPPFHQSKMGGGGQWGGLQKNAKSNYIMLLRNKGETREGGNMG